MNPISNETISEREDRAELCAMIPCLALLREPMQEYSIAYAYFVNYGDFFYFRSIRIDAL